jgi:hypothetical protein
LYRVPLGTFEGVFATSYLELKAVFVKMLKLAPWDVLSCFQISPVKRPGHHVTERLRNVLKALSGKAENHSCKQKGQAFSP